MKKIFKWLWRGLLAVGSAFLSLLSLPPVRNYIWDNFMKKGKKKIVDAKAEVVSGEETEEKKKQGGLFR